MSFRTTLRARDIKLFFSTRNKIIERSLGSARVILGSLIINPPLLNVRISLLGIPQTKQKILTQTLPRRRLVNQPEVLIVSRSSIVTATHYRRPLARGAVAEEQLDSNIFESP
jgi:hypothetical protein